MYKQILGLHGSPERIQGALLQPLLLLGLQLGCQFVFRKKGFTGQLTNRNHIYSIENTQAYRTSMHIRLTLNNNGSQLKQELKAMKNEKAGQTISITEVVAKHYLTKTLSTSYIYELNT